MLYGNRTLSGSRESGNEATVGRVSNTSSGINSLFSMYVCMHVCMYVCMYVCMWLNWLECEFGDWQHPGPLGQS